MCLEIENNLFELKLEYIRTELKLLFIKSEDKEEAIAMYFGVITLMHI